ncbi:MAG: MEKHLA domain-containing protein [Cyanobacteria bacterium P01_G01_bin.54]
MPVPFLNTPFYRQHGNLLCQSYQRFTGQSLLPNPLTHEEPIEALFAAPFALLSHGIEADPIFNFGNQTALTLFELTWAQLLQVPSRTSAEPLNQAERQRLLTRVTEQGYIDDYSGVRISATGRRFLIRAAIVWNLIDAQGQYQGQAAVFDQWCFL